MSDEEHLIENALCALKEYRDGQWDYDYAAKYFKEDEANQWMAGPERLNASLDVVWNMAWYVMFNWCNGRDVDADAQRLFEIDRAWYVGRSNDSDGAENKAQEGIQSGEVDIQVGKGNKNGSNRSQNC